MAIDALRADEKRGAPTRSRLGTLPDRGERVRDSDSMARRAGLEACGAVGRALFAAAPAGGASSGWTAACPASMWTQWRGAKKSTRRVEVMLTQVRARDPDSPGAARAALSGHERGVLSRVTRLAPRRLRDSPPRARSHPDAATKHNLKHTRRSPGGARRSPAPPRRFVLRHLPHLRSTRTDTPIPPIPHSTPLVFQDVPGLGRDGEVLAVKPGRARNHLVPGRMAAYATSDRLPEAAERRAAWAEESALTEQTDEDGREAVRTDARISARVANNFFSRSRRTTFENGRRRVVRRRRFPGFSRFSLDDRETNARGDE